MADVSFVIVIRMKSPASAKEMVQIPFAAGAKGEDVMRIDMAHLRDQGIDFAVFAADARTRAAADRQALLSRLVREARRNGLRIDKAALAFAEAGRTAYFGAPDLVRYLASRGVPRWTHTLDV